MRSVRTVIQPSQFSSNLSQSIFGIQNPFILDDKSQYKTNQLQIYLRSEKISPISKNINIPIKSIYTKVRRFVYQNSNNLATIFDSQTSDFAEVQNFVHVLDIIGQSSQQLNKNKLLQMKTVISQAYDQQQNLFTETQPDSQISEVLQKRFAKSMKMQKIYEQSKQN